MKVEWTPFARSDLEEIVRYIARDDIDAAFRQADRITQAADRLASHPAMGRAGRLPGTRELAVTRTPYLLVYRVDTSTVEVLSVIHGSQAWPPGEGS